MLLKWREVMEFNDITLADKEWLSARFREDNKKGRVNSVLPIRIYGKRSIL